MFEIGTQTKCLNLHILNKLFKFSFWQKELMWQFLFAWSTPWNIGFFLTFFSWRKLCFSILPPNSCYVFMFCSSIFIPVQLVAKYPFHHIQNHHNHNIECNVRAAKFKESFESKCHHQLTGLISTNTVSHQQFHHALDLFSQWPQWFSNDSSMEK